MLQQHSNNNIRAVPVSVTSSNNAVENSAPSPSSESSESSLVLSSSASSTSSHSVHANPGSIVSHDQVWYQLKIFAKHTAVSTLTAVTTYWEIIFMVNYLSSFQTSLSTLEQKYSILQLHTYSKFLNRYNLSPYRLKAR